MTLTSVFAHLAMNSDHFLTVIWPLHGLSFDIQLLITPLVSPNSVNVDIALNQAFK
jgi:hypothetical protein